MTLLEIKAVKAAIESLNHVELYQFHRATFIDDKISFPLTEDRFQLYIKQIQRQLSETIGDQQRRITGAKEWLQTIVDSEKEK